MLLGGRVAVVTGAGRGIALMMAQAGARVVAKLERMSPRDIAPLAVVLASAAAAHVSGQIFGVRGKEVFVFSQPRPVRSIHHAEGWTPERLAEVLPDTLAHHLAPLETSGQYFEYATHVAEHDQEHLARLESLRRAVAG